jgi:hypothetical protein
MGREEPYFLMDLNLWASGKMVRLKMEDSFLPSWISSMMAFFQLKQEDLKDLGR